MNPGFAKIVHQPVVRISSAGRKEEMKSPKVGIVQSTAMMSDAIVAVREVSRFLTRSVFGCAYVVCSTSSRVPRFLPTGRSAGATLLIGSPSACEAR